MKTLKSNINYTLKHDLCTGCGICVDACPSGAISTIVRAGRFLPSVNNLLCKNDKGCHRCHDICPGLGVDLVKIARDKFIDHDIIEDKFVGRYLGCFSGYSNDVVIREKCSTAGVTSQFLIWLLATGKIDGAIITKFDKDAPLKVKTILATTREEVLSAKGSKYAPVSFHDVVKLIKEDGGKKYVIVGLPCHIHGFRKFEAIDKRFREKIIGYFSLFCSGTQTFNYTEYILGQCGINKDNLQYLAYREGHPTGMVADDGVKRVFKEYGVYNSPLKSTFYPRRCLFCVDMFGELADVNLGDLLQDPEESVCRNAIVVRSSFWLDAIRQASQEGALALEEISLERLNYRRTMVAIKKTRNASYLELVKKIGFQTPIYDSKYNAKISLRFSIQYLFSRTKQFIGKHKKLWFLLPKIQ